VHYKISCENKNKRRSARLKKSKHQFTNNLTMETIKQTLFTGWNFMRLIRLGFGVFFAVQAFQTHDTLVGFVAAFFLLTSIFNVGCCGSGGCYTAVNKNRKDNAEEISFDEIE